MVLFTACAAQNPVVALNKAQKKWEDKKIKKSCQFLDKINHDNFARLDRKQKYKFINLRVKCNYYLGRKPKLQIKVDSPWLEYSQALFSIQYTVSTTRAVSILERALKKYPQEEELLYRLGLIYYLDEKFPRGCSLLYKASKLDNYQDVRYILNLGRCYLGWGKLDRIPHLFQKLVKKGVSHNKIKQGIRIIKKAKSISRLFSTPVVQEIRKIKFAVKKEEIASTLSSLNSIIAKYPHVPVIYYIKAVIHMRMGERAKAVVALKRVLALDKEDADALFLLGYLHWQSRNLEKSERFLHRSLQFNPLNPKAYFVLKNIYQKVGDFSQAVVYLQKFIHLVDEEKKNNLYEELAELTVKAGQLRQAVSIYEKVISQTDDKEIFSALLGLAEVHYRLSQTQLDRVVFHRKKAIQLVKQASKIKEADPELAILKKKLGIKDESEEKSEDAMKNKIKIEGAKEIKDDNMF
ncbi:MAG: tetratricopeptide repeat protein [Myxococcota bacterium]